jgi:hypothetical protein
MILNKLKITLSLAILSFTISNSVFANTVLTCKDASAPSNRGYFPKTIIITKLGNTVSVRLINGQLASALTNQDSTKGTSEVVLDTIEVGNTTNYILEKSDSGEPSLVLVADIEAKRAALNIYGAPANIGMTEFLTCK